MCSNIFHNHTFVVFFCFRSNQEEVSVNQELTPNSCFIFWTPEIFSLLQSFAMFQHSENKNNSFLFWWSNPRVFIFKRKVFCEECWCIDRKVWLEHCQFFSWFSFSQWFCPCRFCPCWFCPCWFCPCWFVLVGFVLVGFVLVGFALVNLSLLVLSLLVLYGFRLSAFKDQFKRLTHAGCFVPASSVA